MPRKTLEISVFGAVQKSPSSKAAARFRRGAYSQYVSTENWRERRWRLFSTDPRKKFRQSPTKPSHACADLSKMPIAYHHHRSMYRFMGQRPLLAIVEESFHDKNDAITQA